MELRLVTAYVQCKQHYPSISRQTLNMGKMINHANVIIPFKVTVLTSLEMMPARRARLPRTKENSLTCANPAETSQRMCREPRGRMADSTSTAITNLEGECGMMAETEEKQF